MIKVHIACGDMREVLAKVPENSIDAIVTDPPYGLSFMGKGWDQQVPGPEYWRAVLRVAKPGAHILAFSGTRTGHRLACALEDAGWEIRDCLMWLYGSGFPKSHDISKAIDREAGAEREVIGAGKYANKGRRTDNNTFGEATPSDSERITAPATEAARRWQGWGTALKPAWEPIYLARKPLTGTVAASVLAHGTGALNIDGCRIGTDDGTRARPPAKPTTGTYAQDAWTLNPDNRKPFDPAGLGRWPANLLLDEEAAAALDAQSGVLKNGGPNSGKRRDPGGGSVGWATGKETTFAGDSGGASRFFYVAKASPSEREAGLGDFQASNVNDGRETSIDNPYQRGDTLRKNTHPTVKPVALMRYLIKLITPPDGIVMDPFNGSGSTGIAAVQEGASYFGVEMNPEYVEIAKARIAHAQKETDGKA